MIQRAALFERFVGRDQELAYLIDVRLSAARDGIGRIVLIRGEAGLGKTRLIDEFVRATERERGSFVRVRCYESGSRPFAPFVDALDALARFPGAGGLRISAVRAAITDATTAPDLPAAVDLQQRVFALRRFFEAGSARGSITIAIDDLQWSDLASLEALAAIAEVARHAPIVVIGTLRDEDLAQDTARAAAIGKIERAGVDRVTLRPLGSRVLEASLHEILPDAGSAAIRKIVELSEGKTYIAEELARSVVIHGSESDVQAAVTLRGAVLERVDRLPPEGRSLLVRAAVLGHTVRIDDIAFVTSVAPSELGALLRAARDLQLIAEIERDGAIGFRFRHALTRDILYRELAVVERRALHRAIAERLEASDDRSRLVEIAHHWWCSGETERSREWNERAGDAMRAVGADADAVEPYARALKNLTATDPRYARITLKYVAALGETSRVKELQEAVDVAVRAFTAGGRPVDAIRAYNIFVNHLYHLSHHVDAEPYVAAARALVHPGLPADVAYRFEYNNARLELVRGNLDAAEEAFARAEALVEAPLDRMNLILARAGIPYYRGDFATARAELEEARDISLENENPRVLAMTLHFLAIIDLSSGAVESGRRRLDEAGRTYEDSGWAEMSYRINGLASSAAAMMGAFDDARRHLALNDETQIMRSFECVEARLRLLRAIGTQPEIDRFIPALLERAESQRFFWQSIATHVPWLIARDARRTSEVLRRAVDLLPERDLVHIAYTVVSLGDDELVARVAGSEDRWLFPVFESFAHQLDIALYRSALARRHLRPIEAAAYAREALRVLGDAPVWMERAHALVLNERHGEALDLLAKIGATRERDHLEVAGAPAAKASASRGNGPVKLTGREAQVARLAASGLSSREAAERLGISARTVETHVASAMAKLGVRSRLEIAKALTELAPDLPA